MKLVKRILLGVLLIMVIFISVGFFILRYEYPFASYVELAELNGIRKYKEINGGWPEDMHNYNKFLQEQNFRVYEGPTNVHSEVVRRAVHNGIQMKIILKDDDEFSCSFKGDYLFSRARDIKITLDNAK